ncbi:MAG: hypothetical protein AAFN78_06725 [Pseudomonadota bacterium]
MKHTAIKLACAATFAAALQALSVGATAAEPSATSDKVLVTDFSGRPPFKRTMVSQDSIADMARFEEASVTESGKVWVVDTRGAPPFKRRLVSASDVADIARFEETSDDARRTRRGPPGKTQWRRK